MKLIKIVLSLFTLILLSGVSFAQSSAELQKQRERINQEIQLLNKSLQTTSTNKNLSLEQVNALQAQIKLREQKISTINSEILLIEREIRQNQTEIKNLEEQLETLKKDYASMIRFAFRNKNGYNKLMFIFASSDFNQAFKRIKYLQQFSDSRKKQAKEIQNTQESLKAKIAELDKNRKQKEALLGDQKEERATLNKQKLEKDKVFSNFASQEKEFKNQIQQKKEEAQRLSRAIQAAIKREIEEARRREEAARKAAEEARRRAAEKAAADGKTTPSSDPEPAPAKTDANLLTSTPEAAKLSSDFSSNRGKLPWPVEQGTVTQGFGQQTYGRNVIVNSTGLNIRTNDDAVVRAVFNGEVRSVVQFAAGYAVIIRHGKYFTVYSNLKTVSVSRGQQVSVKQAIGTAAKDPAEGVSEMHFELWEGSAPINPTPWLARN